MIFSKLPSFLCFLANRTVLVALGCSALLHTRRKQDCSSLHFLPVASSGSWAEVTALWFRVKLP